MKIACLTNWTLRVSWSHCSHQSIHGRYKCPPRPHGSSAEARSSRNESNSIEPIPYLNKGKWKAFSNAKLTSDEEQNQINTDYLLALEIERNEICKAKTKVEQLQWELDAACSDINLLKDQRSSPKPRKSSKAPEPHKENVPISFTQEIGLGLNQALSRLSKKLGMMHAIHGDSKGSDPSSNSSSDSSESESEPEPNKKGEPSDDESEFEGHIIFTTEPESDHASNSDQTKKRKHKKCRCHHAKLAEIKYQYA